MVGTIIVKDIDLKRKERRVMKMTNSFTRDVPPDSASSYRVMLGHLHRVALKNRLAGFPVSHGCCDSCYHLYRNAFLQALCVSVAVVVRMQKTDVHWDPI